jgi:hypothetical protein
VEQEQRGLRASFLGQSVSAPGRTVEGHVRSVLMRLDLPESDWANRQVLAVIAYLRAADSTR